MISGSKTTLASIADGDYRSAGKVGIQTLIIGIATVITLGEGAAALAGGKGASGAFARGPTATRDLAQKIANVERIPGNFKRTVVVLETKEGPTIVAGGASDLSAAQIEAAKQLGLTPAPPMPGVHAEPTAIFGAGELGLTPKSGASTNIICAGPGGCVSIIESLGGRVTDKYHFEF